MSLPGPWRPWRLLPGDDLRASLHQRARHSGVAAFVVAGIGSLRQAQIRLAGAASATAIAGPLEILSLSGSCTVDGAHLHISVSDAQGRVTGGHVAPGCTVHTPAELLLAELPAWPLRRAWDPATGYDELQLPAEPGAPPAEPSAAPAASSPPATPAEPPAAPPTPR